ncbi:MAG: hypothetical protein A2044_06590 [Candidatus Firestonebacteria bacterium GWA2_43_8]|nr:MAG: hypothetical protein A2044_06590 [Candidatus Firestonebacteria bacterium GWA2_43_8]
MKVNRNEWKFALIWSVIIAIITIIPYAIGKTYTPKDMVFTEFIASNYDQESYMAWMKQAADGKILFEDKYTTEPQSGMFFHPLFLVCGRIAGLLNMDMITAYHGMRLLFGILMLLFIYYFSAHFIKDVTTRKYFLVFISLAAGWGFLAPNPVVWFNQYNIMSLDMWITEASTFLIFLTKPLFAFALILILAIFLLMLKAFETGKSKFVYYAGVLGILLALTHPYDVFSVYAVLFVFLLAKKAVLKEYLLFFLFAAVSVCGLAYQAVLFTYDPVFKEWSKTLTATPNPLSFVIGYGFAGIFTILYLFDKKWSKDKSNLFLLIWIISILAASYLPLRFQRRMILGLHVPIAILGVKYFFECLIPKLKKFRPLKNLKPITIFIILMVLSIPTNVRYIYDCYTDMKINVYNYNIHQDDVTALRWMDANTDKKDAFIASRIIGMYIPAWSGNKVYAGHYDQTVNYTSKLKEIKVFFEGKVDVSTVKEFLEANRISYIYFGPFEKMLGNPGFEKMPFLQKEYSNKTVDIYRINL